jgi:lipopolysaccharide biosynthesis glycosyltransferase
MGKNLVATLADENFVEQTKQLFSSVYHNAGWKGDYLLLSAGIPEDKLKWFRNKGILIYKCIPLSNDTIGLSKRSPITLCKFYLFKPEFKKWENIIFLDADIIVKAPIDNLAKVKGFAAAYNAYNKELRLRDEFLGEQDITTKEQSILYQKLIENFNLRGKTFNAGVMAFNTQIIEKNTFSKLNSLFMLYKPVHVNGDQPTFNLFFYKNWQHLPRVYNASASVFKLKCIILHAMGKSKLWFPESYYYNEWKNNLQMAKNIDISKTVQNIKPWPELKIWIYNFLFYLFFLIYPIIKIFDRSYCEIDRRVGLIGKFIKKNCPRLYDNLNTIKVKINKIKAR